MRKLGSIFKNIRLSNDSLIIVKKGSALDTPEILDQLTLDLKRLKIDAIVIVADSLDDVNALNQQAMARLGWFRLPQLRRLAHVKPEGDKLETEEAHETPEANHRDT
jgi:hypothetical protein